MISLVPYVRETFRRHLSQKQAVMLVEFDKLKRVRFAPNRRSLPKMIIMYEIAGLSGTSERDSCEAYCNHGRPSERSHTYTSGD